MSLPNPVEQKSYDVINNKLSLVMKEVAEESMKRAAVEENSSSPDNLLTVSGDGTWKTRGHSSLIGVCTVIRAETGMPFDVEDITNAFVIIDDLMNEVGDDKKTFKLGHERKPS
ncbi:hypothetical protein TNCV_850291 [Trichonephila clavipes]|uniref:Mutator-like transposase domain-containing protein n=1 Tax=Trichonephila clavipes TaxID=2585209 RepID=A0A8X6RVJ9_TRICX|nr:hypothetical protein TNCV_850291 [Trichonephila clavipes]